jgi:hypothetical protein
VFGPSQRLLPDNTQHLQDTDVNKPEGFEPAIPANEGQQSHALERPDTGIGMTDYGTVN